MSFIKIKDSLWSGPDICGNKGMCFSVTLVNSSMNGVCQQLLWRTDNTSIRMKGIFFFFLFKWKLLGKQVAECLYRTRSVLLQLINLFEGLLWTTGIWINAFIFLNYISSVHNELLLSIKARIGRRNLGVGKSPADRGVGLCCLNIFKWMGFSCQGES